ncbi:sialin-like [Diorhabda carinulata]|uniref:sialin-like n=1 Tax=Diorhabda carinulata TaxID=1163345 RepID=UPI0025A16A0A|nr:sialin-like [Diorhabda carinulata]
MFKWQWRYWILVMVYLSAYMNYSYTVNMAFSIIPMVSYRQNHTPECIHKVTENKTNTLPDYGPRYNWDEHKQGAILGAYFWSHSFFSLPAGPISEYFGPAKVIFYATIMGAIINALCVPAAWIHYGVLVLFRFLLGVVGAVIYPALQCLIAQWAPPHERGKFVAGLLGNTMSTVVTWPLLGFVTTHFGWDWGFYALSFEMLLYALIFFVVASDNPDSHRFISAEEVAYIKECQGDSVSRRKHAKVPYKDILKNIPFWILCILHFGNLWGLYLQLQSVPKFMAEVIGFDLRDSGIVGAIPSLTRFFFSVTYGVVGDYLDKNTQLSTKVLRKSFVVASHIIPGVLMFSITFIGCHWQPIVALLTFSMSINGAVVLTNLMNPQDLAPNYAGTIFGMITFIDGTTGFIGPAVTAAFIQEHNGLKEWSYTFIVGGCMYILCGIIFILFGSVEEQSWNHLD